MKFISAAAAVLCVALETSAFALTNMSREPLCGTPPFGLSVDGGMSVSVFASSVKCKDQNKYVFDFGDGTPTSDPTPALTKVTHTYEKPGSYSVQSYIVKDDGSLAPHVGRTVKIGDQ